MLVFTVEGRPVPQGSMTASYNRKTQTAHVHHVQGAALAQWRADIRREARAAGAVIITAPVVLYVSFGMQRPIAQTQLYGGRRIVKPEYRQARPGVAPDIDKLVRAVLDALTGVAYEDDSRVVTLHARKVYASATRIKVDYAEQAPPWMGEIESEGNSEGQGSLSLLP